MTDTSNLVYTIDLKGHGCACCGCPVCSDRHVPNLRVTLPQMVGGSCGSDCDVLNVTHILTYGNNNYIQPVGQATALGCCEWAAYVTSDCANVDPLPDGSRAYRLQAKLCVVGCEEDVEAGTKTCQWNWEVTVKALNNPLIVESSWDSINFVTLPIDQVFLPLACCQRWTVGMVFDDGGPTCDGDFGIQNSHPSDACKPFDISECVIIEPICDTGMALTLAFQESAAPLIPRISPFQKAKNVTDAFMKWSMAGFPKRSPERIQQIFDQQCSPCPYFKNNECTKCGCPVVRGDNFRNKLLWATESCPLTPPKWEAEA